MAGKRNQTSSEHKSWRQAGSAARRKPAGSRSKQRWSLTVAALLLLVLFVGLIVMVFLTRTMRTHFITLAAGDYHKLSVPPIPWHTADLNTDDRPRAKYLRFVDASQYFEEIDTIPSDVSGRVKSQDCVIFYAAAHAVPNAARDGVELVLLDDRRCSVRNLITQIQKFPAETKLLLLDCGRLTTDLHYDLLVNDFPNLLVSEVRTATAPGAPNQVWVMASRGICQADTGWFGASRTTFATSVLDGLSGAADHDANNYVDLQELYGYVSARCQRESGEIQQPILLQTGSSDTTLALPALRLAALPRVRKSQAEPTPPPAAPAANDTPPVATTGPQPPADTVNDATSRNATTNPPAALAAETSAAETSAAEPTTAPPPSPTATAENPAAVAPAATAAETAAPPVSTAAANAAQAPASSPDAADHDRYLTLLDRAWHLRDELQGPTVLVQQSSLIGSLPVDQPPAAPPWSPVEYMPHLWHEFHAILIQYELRHAGYQPAAKSDQASASAESQADDPASVPPLAQRQLETNTKELQNLIAGLERLREELHAQSSERSREGVFLIDRMSDWTRYSLTQQANRQTFYPESPELLEVANGVRQAWRIEFELADFVRWYGHAQWLQNSVPSRQFSDVESRLQAALRDLEAYYQWQRDPQHAVLRDGDIAFWRVRQQALAKSYRGLRDAWSSWLTKLASGNAHDCAMAEQMLATPLLDAEQRIQLRRLVATRSSSASIAFSPAKRVSIAVPPNLPRPFADSTATLTRATLQLAAMAEATDGSTEATSAAGLLRDNGLWYNKQPTAAPSWSEIGDTSLQLTTVKQNVRRRLSDPTDDADMVRASLQSLDGRDSFRVDPWTHPRLTITQPQPFDFAWQSQPPTSIQLTEEARRIDMSLRANQEPPGPLEVELLYDDTQLRIGDGRPGKGTWPQRRIESFEWDATRTATIPVQITSRVTPDQGTIEPTEIRLRVRCGELAWRESTIRCEAPPPNQIVLLVDHFVQGDVIEYPASMNRVQEIPLFPNRTNVYRMRLQNLTGEPQTVTAKFYRLQGDVGGRAAFDGIPPGRLINENGQLYDVFQSTHWIAGDVVPGLELVAQSKGSVELPPNERIAIDFGDPSQAPPGDSPPAAAAAAPPATEPDPSPVDYGMLCVIRSETDLSQVWLQWVGWKTIMPTEYTQFETTYDADRILGQLQWRSNARQPILGNTPIGLNWDVSVLGQAIVPSKRSDQLRTPEGMAQIIGGLNSEVPTPREVPVWVDVDGYPRAYKHQLLLREGQKGIDQRDEEPWLLDFLRAELTESKRLYALQLGAIAEPPEAPEISLLDATRSRRMIFQVPARDQSLWLDFKVDAPLYRLRAGDRNDRIELRLRSKTGERMVEVESYRYYRDRQQQVALLKAEPAGRMSFRNTLSDYRVRIPISGGTRGEFEFVLHLQLDGAPSGTQTVSMFLDADRPDILRPTVRPARPQEGKPFDVTIRVRDDSDAIESVSFGLVKESNAAPAEPVSADPTGLSPDAAGEFRFVGRHPGAPAGKYSLKITAIDASGRERSGVTPLDVDAPPAPLPEAKPVDYSNYKGTVSGIVSAGGTPVYFADVSLGGDGAPMTAEAQTDANGKFKFENVPVGKYTIEASRFTGGTNRQGQAQMTLEKPEDYLKPVSISLK